MNIFKLYLCLAVLCSSYSVVYGSDWMFIGAGSHNGKDGWTFYDNETVKYMSNGNVRVWLKSIKVSDLHEILEDETKNKPVIQSAGKKIADNYQPPYMSVVPNVNNDSYIDIVANEAAVTNYPYLVPLVKLFFEIDCNYSMIRTLSGVVYKNENTPITSDKISEWSYISPDTTGSNLYKVLCSRRK